MAPAPLLDLVDKHQFRELFIEQMGWSNPDRPEQSFDIEGATYTLRQVARFEGLRVWWCDELPARKVQRALDAAVARDDMERLVIFTGEGRQEWRWPRRAQTGAVPAKLLVHEHVEGAPDEHLLGQLLAIRLGVLDQVNLVQMLQRMRAAFDEVAESNAVKAARLMKSLYRELETAGVGEHEATLLLARLLFLFFGDDTNMWAANQFHDWLADHTRADTLHDDLAALFEVLNTDERHRELPAHSALGPFRYINGGLFEDPLRLPTLGMQFRDALLEACEFGWSVISPAVFGSMFQTVKDKDARRGGGEHYTTEQNILKTLEPLFLDELRDRLDKAWDDKAALTRLHNDLGRLRVMDPACGCGNFLIVAYRELRSLELELMRRRRALDEADGRSSGKVSRSQLTLDVTGDIKVRLDHFAGIEIDDWPAQIARTAMLLVDHLANQAMAEDFGIAPDRLPIRIATKIERANALHIDWASVLPATDDTIVVGNPPFVGRKYRTREQVADMRSVWGKAYNVNLDYVSTWYAKALRYFGTTAGRWAFVSTNSVAQGEAVATLWAPILGAGWKCRFAHRSFSWQTEASDGAKVHVSIVGFDRGRAGTRSLWTYPDGPDGAAHHEDASRINPYLIDAPDVLVRKRSTPLSSAMPTALLGNMPIDDGNLVVTPEQYEDVMKDPIAAKYVKPFVGARELLHGNQRWVLWLKDMPASDALESPVLATRLAAVRDFRLDSTNDETVEIAETPHLFWFTSHPMTNYLCIPSTVGESRRFFTPAYFSPDIISSNANYVAADPDGFLFGILSSSVWMAWMKSIGGRLKSDLRFSSTYTYNTFPLPPITASQRAEVSAAALRIQATRLSKTGASLAQLYAAGREPAELIAAHEHLDSLVDALFGAAPEMESRQRALFASYIELAGPGF